MNSNIFAIFVVVLLTVVTVTKSKPSQPTSDLVPENSVNACGGGCYSTEQCVEHDNNNPNCQCTWFACKLVQNEKDARDPNPIEDLKIGIY